MGSSRPSTTRWGHLYRLSRWKKASEAFRASPEGALCIDCKAQGKIVPSEVTDHIVPHSGDLDLFWDPANWAPRCWSCHSVKSRADEFEARTGKIQLRKGCDAHGIPLDPRSHWHQERDR